MCNRTKYMYLREQRGNGVHRFGVIVVRKIRKNGTKYAVSYSVCHETDAFVGTVGVAKAKGKLDQAGIRPNSLSKMKVDVGKSVLILDTDNGIPTPRKILRDFGVSTRQFNVDWDGIKGKIADVIDFILKDIAKDKVKAEIKAKADEIVLEEIVTQYGDLHVNS